MKIEVAIPCYNEEMTITKVIRDFRSALPEADIVVYDNNSSDRSALLAMEEGARVVPVNQQGKGWVVKKIFEQSDVDIVVMVDGDDTYEAKDVKSLIHPIYSEEADMTIGTRLHTNPLEFRKFHHFGNRILTHILNALFRTHYQDILSGYRAFNRRFIENVPVVSRGFEIETELMIQALEQGMSIKEIPIGFRNRPAGSDSKLSSIRDGYRIILVMIMLLRDHKPLLTFTLVSIISFLIGLSMWIIGLTKVKYNPFLVIFRNGGAGLMMISIGLFLVGLTLNTINTRMRELMSLLKRRSR